MSRQKPNTVPTIASVPPWDVITVPRGPRRSHSGAGADTTAVLADLEQQAATVSARHREAARAAEEQAAQERQAANLAELHRAAQEAAEATRALVRTYRKDTPMTDADTTAAAAADPPLDAMLEMAGVAPPAAFSDPDNPTVDELVARANGVAPPAAFSDPDNPTVDELVGKFNAPARTAQTTRRGRLLPRPERKPFTDPDNPTVAELVTRVNGGKA